MLLYNELEFTDVPEITTQLLELAQEFNPTKFYAAKFEISLLEQRVPKLKAQLDSLGLVVSNFREFVAEPYGGFGIHQDGTSNYIKKCALNWPIENTAGTYMVWWDLLPGAKPLFGNNDPSYENDVRYESGNTIFFYNESDAIEKFALELVRPTLVNVYEYHSIRNHQTAHRRMISIRFENEPVHLLAQ